MNKFLQKYGIQVAVVGIAAWFLLKKNRPSTSNPMQNLSEQDITNLLTTINQIRSQGGSTGGGTGGNTGGGTGGNTGGGQQQMQPTFYCQNLSSQTNLDRDKTLFFLETGCEVKVLQQIINYILENELNQPERKILETGDFGNDTLALVYELFGRLDANLRNVQRYYDLECFKQNKRERCARGSHSGNAYVPAPLEGWLDVLIQNDECPDYNGAMPEPDNVDYQSEFFEINDPANGQAVVHQNEMTGLGYFFQGSQETGTYIKRIYQDNVLFTYTARRMENVENDIFQTVNVGGVQYEMNYVNKDSTCAEIKRMQYLLKGIAKYCPYFPNIPLQDYMTIRGYSNIEGYVIRGDNTSGLMQFSYFDILRLPVDGKWSREWEIFIESIWGNYMDPDAGYPPIRCTDSRWMDLTPTEQRIVYDTSRGSLFYTPTEVQNARQLFSDLGCVVEPNIRNGVRLDVLKAFLLGRTLPTGGYMNNNLRWTNIDLRLY